MEHSKLSVRSSRWQILVFVHYLLSVGSTFKKCFYSKPEERRKAVLASYADYFGPKIHDYLEYTEKDWNAEPYNGGCPVSMCQPGVMRYMHPGLRLPFQR